MTVVSSEFKEKNVLITGGLGFIGSNLAIRMVQAGAKITLVDPLHPRYSGILFNIEPIRDKVEIIFADMGDRTIMERIIPGQNFIFNIAGQVSHLDSMKNPQHDLAVNAFSHLAMIELCRKLNPNVKIIYAGTRQVYGIPQFLPVNEKHPVMPIDYNGISKIAGEWYHMVAHRNFGLRAVSLRMTNVYGPRMRVKDARKTFIGEWFRLLIEDKELQVFGTGQQMRDLNYIDDVIDALLGIALHPQSDGNVYNLGGNEPISLLDLAKLMITISGSGRYRIRPFPPSRKRIDIGSYYGDYTKIQQAIGWNPTISLLEGVQRTLAYYRQYKKYYW